MGTDTSARSPVERAGADETHPTQFALLKQRRFASLLWTQFSGAAKGNLFKFGFTVLVTYQLSVSWFPAHDGWQRFDWTM
jgi:hypothetical protein